MGILKINNESSSFFIHFVSLVTAFVAHSLETNGSKLIYNSTSSVA